MELSAKILSDIVVYSKYAKYLPEVSRRETYSEIVDRNKEMHLKKFPMLKEEIEQAYSYVYDKKVFPSMRSMQFAGKAIQVNPARIYNCSYCPIDHPDAFSEAMFLLLSGVGFGYSVQKHHVKKLPEIKKTNKTRRYLIGDSIEGWSDAIKVMMNSYFYGKSIPIYDFSDIRPKGAMLITSGGKAPGPEPLRQCLINIKNILDRKEFGSKLTSLEVHDILCYIADAVLAGGIRRSAMISLFDFDDEEMLSCKSNLQLPPVDNNTIIDSNNNTCQFYVDYLGDRKSITLTLEDFNEYSKTHTLPFYYVAPHRGRANNSAAILRHKIEKSEFFNFWKLIESNKSGEPGIFFTNDKDLGTNPCAEVSLKPGCFCNLTSINISDVVTQEELNARVKSASFIGTLQASYTGFHYLRDFWKEQTEKDALIGVSMTGVANKHIYELDFSKAAEVVKLENARLAKLIGINKAARTTTLKPEGTLSLVAGSSSGIHAWHNDYYIRRMRVGKNEALYQYLEQNIPELVEDDFINSNRDACIVIPIKSPDGSITRHESPLDLLNRVKYIFDNWIKTGHRKGSNYNNVSTTVSIRDSEWGSVGNWMWQNRDKFTAISVLPFDNGTYKQAPFEDLTKTQYEKMLKHLTEVDLSNIIETENGTSLNETIACGGNACELVSL